MRRFTILPLALALLAAFPSVALAAKHEFVVTGRFLYEDKAWDYSGWTGSDPELPVRFADVNVLDASTGHVVGRGMTDAEGDFAVDCRTSKELLDVSVRLDSDTRRKAKADKAFPRLAVMTTSKAIYSAFAPTVHGHPTDSDLDVGETTVLKVLSGQKEGNPFNVLDAAVSGLLYVTGPEIGAKHKSVSLRVYWPNPLGSYALGRKCWISTNDGYDDSVILHEIGHVVHNVWSDSDNPGGIHYFGDSDQDPRLSFGEGYATAFAGAVLAHDGSVARYVDSSASAQVGGYQLHLELEDAVPYLSGVLGASDEVAVACVLYDLMDGDDSADDVPDDDALTPTFSVDGVPAQIAWWEVFVGPVKKARAVTMNRAWDGWLKLHEDDPAYDALRDVYEDRELLFVNDAAEPDNDPETATPIVAVTDTGTWVTDHTLYYAEDGLGPGRRDKDWFAVELQAGQRVDVETRYPAGAYDATTQADTWLALYDPSGKRRAWDDDSGFGRNARIAGFDVGTSGTWHVMVRSKNRVRDYGRYELRVLRVD